MLKAEALLDRESAIGEADRRLFGAFVEHLGRSVYGGIYEPGHPSADARGFRRDVLALVRELGATIIRYPGGNFVSGYDWEDGVGPKDERPRRLDLAWRSTESNRFGTNEFIDWCRAAGTEPMLAVNLGTRGPAAASDLIEYCNHPGGTRLSELRRRHGYAEPHAVKLWCLGNEMDGPWQIGAKTAGEYGRVAAETAKMMKSVDPSIELVACGSSHHAMPSFGRWEEEVLRHTLARADYVSLHSYFDDCGGDSRAFLAVTDLMGRHIEDVVAIADRVAAEQGSDRRLMLSFDEWNVWYRTREEARSFKPGWPEAPALLEEAYNMEDALVVGGALITLLNHADRVRVACLAQLVNVIAPIMTETGGAAWRQTIFHPFAQAARFGKGRVLRSVLRSPSYASGPLKEVAYLQLAALHDPARDDLTLFAVNRSLTEPLELDLALRAFAKLAVVETLALRHEDLKASNSKERPDFVTPAASEAASYRDGRLRALFPPASWNLVRLRRQG
jgi:alpha-L-arabinofuranosidase